MEVIAIRITQPQREFLDGQGNRSRFIRSLINTAMVGGEIKQDAVEVELDALNLVEDIFNMGG